jgi:hypothetical protein
LAASVDRPRVRPISSNGTPNVSCSTNAEPLGRRQRVEHDQQGEADGVGEQRLGLRVGLVAVGHHGVGQAAAADSSGGPRGRAACRGRPGPPRGEPAAEVVDRGGVGAGQPHPGLLHRVLGVGQRAEHPVRDRAQPSPLGVEPPGQQIAFVHGSPSAAGIVTTMTLPARER